MFPLRRATAFSIAVVVAVGGWGAVGCYPDFDYLLDTPHEVDSGTQEDPCLDAGDRGDGSTFTDLYTDFFGPTGRASCSASSICHVPGGEGASVSGYMCSPDQGSCWTSMTSSIVPEGGSSSPDDTILYGALRKAPPTAGSGPMPLDSTFEFCPGDLARIKAWIAAGAKND
jgi:hypothetical protein